MANKRFRPVRLPLTIGLLLALLVLAALIAIAGTGQEWLLGILDQLEQHTIEHLVPVLIGFVLGFAIMVTVSLPVATLFCLAGGYLFGTALGFLAALTGACSGAAMTFILARWLGDRVISRRTRAEPWLKALENDATWYLILLRIVPVAPFFAVNAAAGITRITLTHFLLASALGLVPTTLVYVAIGAGLNSLLDAHEMLGPGMLLRPEIGLPLLGLFLIVVASWVLRRRMRPRSEAL